MMSTNIFPCFVAIMSISGGVEHSCEAGPFFLWWGFNLSLLLLAALCSYQGDAAPLPVMLMDYMYLNPAVESLSSR